MMKNVSARRYYGDLQIMEAQMKFEPVLFRHPLMDGLPSAPDKEVLLDLLNLTILGDTSAKQQLIQHLLLVAKRCVGTILAVYPSSRNELEEMVSEAALVVVDITERLIRGLQIDPTKLSNYTAVAVLWRVNEMLAETESAIRVPYTVQRTNHSLGREKVAQFQDETFDNLHAPECGSDFEVREALESVISAPIERRIIELREASYSDREIGVLLGVSRQTVTLLRFNLYQRYVEATQ
jgi:hypothetical protein